VRIDLISPLEQWRALGDGYRVGVRIVAVAQDKVLRVPVSAVFPRPNDAVGTDADTRMAAFVIDGDRARLREVTVAGRNGELAWISSGLRDGDRVILYPGDAVVDGIRVQPRTVPMAR
jgi:HlyD family secretion protein